MANHRTPSPRRTAPSTERRTRPRTDDSGWRTAITRIQPNEILIRGYAVDELMGRLSFAEAIYLILRGELPTPTMGKLFGAVLVASIDHGVTPPSTLAARNVATSGARIRACVAAGVLGFGMYHGGDVETCMRFLEDGLARVRDVGESHAESADALIRGFLDAGRPLPGFGHRLHSTDPRASRLLQMAHELELDGEHVQFVRAIERRLEGKTQGGHPIPLNIDGAIAAVCADMGFEPELGNALFMIARIPGLVAHAHEERVRQHPMRQIDPKDASYDGPPPRRLPETRK